MLHNKLIFSNLHPNQDKSGDRFPRKLRDQGLRRLLRLLPGLATVACAVAITPAFANPNAQLSPNTEVTSNRDKTFQAIATAEQALPVLAEQEQASRLSQATMVNGKVIDARYLATLAGMPELTAPQLANWEYVAKLLQQANVSSLVVAADTSDIALARDLVFKGLVTASSDATTDSDDEQAGDATTGVDESESSDTVASGSNDSTGTVNEDATPANEYEVSVDTSSLAAAYSSYQKLLNHAKKYARNPNPEYLQKILQGLDKLAAAYYTVGGAERGNWWNYEIGIPKALGQTILILYKDLTPEQRFNYMLPSYYFQPDPYLSGVSPGAKFSSSPNLRVSTGGNRLDTALVAFYRGLIMNNPQEVQNALNSINETVVLVERGDGFHKDGSFIQHNIIGYNGTYGKVLLEGFALLQEYTQGTKFVFGDDNVFNLFASFKDSYGYLMINGGITDAVSGRAVYKYNNNWKKDNDTLLTHYSRSATSSDLERGRELTKIFAKIGANVVEKTDNKYFYKMDRLVHRNPAQGAIVLAMNSNRIASFEAINGDNPYGIYTGDGQTYIYGRDPSANVGYFLDYNYHYVPGVTAIYQNIKPYQGEKRRQNDLHPTSFTGAVSLADNSQFVAFEQQNWDNSLSAYKSYLVSDKGMRVYGYTDYSGAKDLYTTLDQRRLVPSRLDSSKVVPLKDELLKEGASLAKANAQVTATVAEQAVNHAPQVYVDGVAVTSNTKYATAPKEVVFVDDVGTKITYKLYDIPNLEVVFEQGFVRFVTYHSNSISYGIYPQTDANDPLLDNLQLIKASTNEQIFYAPTLQRSYMNFFSPGKHCYDGVCVDAQAQVVKYHDNDGNLVLELNDPTQEALYPVGVTLTGDYQLVAATTAVTDFNASAKRTKFNVNLTTMGESVRLVLKSK